MTARLLLVAAVAAFSLAAFVDPAASQSVPAYVTAGVNDSNRPAADRMRDVNRKPAESVAFSEVKPGDKVVDFLAGGGYFTRILSKVVGPSGHVYATAPSPAMGGMGEKPTMGSGMPNGNSMASTMGRTPAMGGMGGAGALQAIAADPAYANVSVLVQSPSKLMVPEPVDVVWTSQNYHDLHNPGTYHADDMAAFNKSVYDALKPGGVFLVIDYASAPGTGFTQTSTLHRAEPDAEKAEILKAGFVFEGESNVLRRPKDPHTTRAHEQDDQFIFRFRKPR
jgi:predicted methyltransferase